MTPQTPVQILMDATKAFVAGELGERELIAVTMAVNDHIGAVSGPSYAAMAAESRAALEERVAELDRGEA